MLLPNKTPNNRKPSKRPLLNMYWMYAMVGLALVGLYFFQNNDQTRKVDWTEFEKAALAGDIERIVVIASNAEADGYLTDAGAKRRKFDMQPGFEGQRKLETTIPSPDKIQEKIDSWNAALASEKKPPIKVSYERGGDLMRIFWAFGPILLIFLGMYFISRRMGGAAGGGGGIFNVGKSRATVFDKDKGTHVTFKDVAGLAEAKVEIEEIVEFLKNPQRYTELGAKIPKGALLVGPPGTGKTLLAKAVAGEANVPFLSTSGSDFVEMFVGVGAARVRDLFKQAQEKAPCIVFIDEIDAVGRARGKNPNMGGNDERENTLNQMLTAMDGFGTNNGVIILAATNRADMLDKALLRPGRFDRQIYVDLPDLNERVEIFKVHLRNIKTAPDLDIDLLARQTPGFSGADIANVCNEAALIAARNDKKEVTREDFIAAVDRIIGGLEKRTKITTDEEKRAIAVHEAGHAAVSWNLRYANPLVKVTIVPRGKALGAAWYLPEERQITPTEALLDQLCSLLGGRAAEELFLGHVSTGAANDLERVTKQAYAMVVYYGMSDRLPNLCYYDSTGQDYGFSKPYSNERAKIIDEEVSRIISEQYQRAKDILTKYAKEHHELAELLIKREVIFTDDAARIFGPRKWASRTDEILGKNGDTPALPEASPAEGSESDNQSDSGDSPAQTPPPYNPE